MDIQRYLDTGCILAEDLGSINNKFSYIGTTTVNSPFGRARSFNGISDSVLLNRHYIKNTNTYTIAMKVKISSVNTNNTIYYHAVESTGGASRIVISYDSLNKIRFGGRGNDGDSFTTFVLTPELTVEDRWITLVCVYDGPNTIAKVFVNGTTYQATIVNKTLTNSNPFIYPLIGKSGINSDYFNGSIKEMIVQTRAWTDQEILNYHNNCTFCYDKNIVSRWNLDDASIVKDMGWKNLGNNGSVSGAAVTDSIVGKALSFDGVDDKIYLPDMPIFTTDAPTMNVSLWINFRSTSNTISFFSNYYQGIPGSVTGMAIAFRGDTKRFRISFGDSITRNSSSMESTFLPTINTWYHLGLNSSGSGVALFINSILNVSSSATIAANQRTNMNFIGASHIGTVWFANAIIAKPVIFDKPLTQLEIKDLINRQLRGDL